MVRRVCAFHFLDGRACGAAPLRDSAYCLFHDPDHADAVAEARTVVGQRRRKEATLATVYDLEDITSDAGIRRLAQIAVSDLLSLDTTLNKVRAMLYAVQTLIKVRESGDLADRVNTLEAVVSRQGHGPDPFADVNKQDDEEVR